MIYSLISKGHYSLVIRGPCIYELNKTMICEDGFDFTGRRSKIHRSLVFYPIIQFC